MHEVLVNRLGGLSLPRKSVVRLTDRPDMTLDVYRGRKTAMQQQQNLLRYISQQFPKMSVITELNQRTQKMFTQPSPPNEDAKKVILISHFY